MKDNLENEEYVGILWAPIKHRWLDILSEINKDGAKLTSALIYSPTDISDDVWYNFVVGCYLSHEKIDNPRVDLNSKIQKIYKKLKYEHLDKCERKLCVFTFVVEDKEKISGIITDELKNSWGYTEERILENYSNLTSTGMPYELNIMKDIVRKRFCNDEKLPNYYKGAYAGRKRIMHTPASTAGCVGLWDFLLTHLHEEDTIKI